MAPSAIPTPQSLHLCLPCSRASWVITSPEGRFLAFKGAVNAVAVEPDFLRRCDSRQHLFASANSYRISKKASPSRSKVSFPPWGGAFEVKEHISSPLPSEHPHLPLVLYPVSTGRLLHRLLFRNTSWPPATIIECCLTYVSVCSEKRKVQAGLHHLLQGGVAFNCRAIVKVNVKLADEAQALAS